MQPFCFMAIFYFYLCDILLLALMQPSRCMFSNMILDKCQHLKTNFPAAVCSQSAPSHLLCLFTITHRRNFIIHKGWITDCQINIISFFKNHFYQHHVHTCPLFAYSLSFVFSPPLFFFLHLSSLHLPFYRSFSRFLLSYFFFALPITETMVVNFPPFLGTFCFQCAIGDVS